MLVRSVREDADFNPTLVRLRRGPDGGPGLLERHFNPTLVRLRRVDEIPFGEGSGEHFNPTLVRLRLR